MYTTFGPKGLKKVVFEDKTWITTQRRGKDQSICFIGTYIDYDHYGIQRVFPGEPSYAEADVLNRLQRKQKRDFVIESMTASAAVAFKTAFVKWRESFDSGTFVPSSPVSATPTVGPTPVETSTPTVAAPTSAAPTVMSTTPSVSALSPSTTVTPTATTTEKSKVQDALDACDAVLKKMSEPKIDKVIDPDNAEAKIPNHVSKETMNKVISFFSEFGYGVGNRFVNTFALTLKAGGKSAGKTYLSNYFDLSGNSEAANIKAKLNSLEFDAICDDFTEAKAPKNVINKRLRIFYGPTGAGKTVTALKISEGRSIICNSSMLPSDLLEDFGFKDGKPCFEGSAMVNAMTEGKAITLDEINLLPFETIRFLQGLCDSKPSFLFKGKKIKVKDGFEVIGTMNLVLGGQSFSLPEPLVDRCSEIKEFKESPEELVKGFDGLSDEDFDTDSKSDKTDDKKTDETKD